MAKINWRQRFTAVAVHLAATLLVTGIAALLIFFVWFPDGLASVTGGMELFLLVVGCDAALGPFVSLFIYDPTKGRGKLLFDYTIVGALQLAALAYGIFVVAQSRPAIVAFDAAAIQIVTPMELEPADLIEASERQYRTLPLDGPRLVSVQRPTDPKELADLVFLMIAGAGPGLKPKYYRDYDEAREAIQEAGLPIDLLLNGTGDKESAIRSGIARTRKDGAQLRWLPVRHRFGEAVALIDADTLHPLYYLPVEVNWIKPAKSKDKEVTEQATKNLEKK